ncbi:MAG: gamma-glutamyltransferase [Bryobacterales bacterium]|nr:gamma-glutamyltransferase [Bryobacterales bacterium]
MSNLWGAVALLPLALSVAMPASPNRSQARSMVVSRHGIVATSQTLASQAGAQVLARGGSAMDAAIAANAVLGVVEPMSNGIGGDLFALYWEKKTGKLYGINASGWSPAGLTPDYIKTKNSWRMPQDGIDSVTVPGCVAGWEALQRKFGRLRWTDVFQPAIHFAREGFPVTEIIAEHWELSQSVLRADENARPLFLPGDKAPRTGEIFRNPDLARAYLEIARNPRSFYTGGIGKAIVALSQKLSGTLAAADLAEFEPEWVTPVSTTYRGWTVYELPPNGQGIAALTMLNLMERFPLDTLDPLSADALHIKIEAQKLAYADLVRYVADPRFAKVPVAGMLSKDYAAERARLIDRRKASDTAAPGKPPEIGTDTIYLAAVDREGNIASLIQSLYVSFGSGVLVPGYGFHLQNRGALFELDPDHPNVVAPRKRPFHTIIPAFAENGDRKIGFGIMGGFNQAQAHAQFISSIVDGQMNLQAALEAPRFTKLTFGGSDVMIEGRVRPDIRVELTERGHRLDVLGDFNGWMGGGQAVMHDAAAGVNFGASSPRKDGAAVPEPAPYFSPRARR